MKVYDFDPQSLPDDVLKAVGLYIACSSATEAAVNLAIATLLGVDDLLGAIVTTHMANPQRIGALRSLAAERLATPTARQKVEQLALEIGEAFQRRNAVAHQEFITDPEDGKVYSVKQSARKVLQSDLIPVSAEEIVKEAIRLNTLGQELVHLIGLSELRQAAQ